jgi:hypothetical protein
MMIDAHHQYQNLKKKVLKKSTFVKKWYKNTWMTLWDTLIENFEKTKNLSKKILFCLFEPEKLNKIHENS